MSLEIWKCNQNSTHIFLKSEQSGNFRCLHYIFFWFLGCICFIEHPQKKKEKLLVWKLFHRVKLQVAISSRIARLAIYMDQAKVLHVIINAAGIILMISHRYHNCMKELLWIKETLAQAVWINFLEPTKLRVQNHCSHSVLAVSKLKVFC